MNGYVLGTLWFIGIVVVALVVATLVTALDEYLCEEQK